jgi:hypothetical protein
MKKAMMMEAANPSETSENLYQTTWRNNPEDSRLHNLCFLRAAFTRNVVIFIRIMSQNETFEYTQI